MAVKKKLSRSDSRTDQGFFKWIIKCILTHVGCLSKQDLEKQDPLNEASFDDIIDCVDHLDAITNQSSLVKKNDQRKQNENFVEVLSGHQNCNDKKNKEKTTGTIMSFQNCTLQCADPGNGESYWVSFEEKSFSKGDDFKVYSGRMNGIGPKSGEKCVVKVFRRCKGTENMCRCEVKKCKQAKILAKSFNDVMLSKKMRIKFSTLYWAQMDEVSKIKQLFFTGMRKLTTRETVLFEDDLRVHDEKPHRHRDLILFMDCLGKKKRCIAKDLEAFAHFTYHLSNGELVLCGFEGVQDDHGFFLKTPTIHSRTQEYGNSDRGLQGILEVFENHVCNDFCKDMMKPNLDVNNVPAEIINNVLVGQCSTLLPSAAHEQEYRIPHIAYRPPLERQDSVVSKGSYITDHTMTYRQDSNLSQVTESLSGYLEPSAPFEDCNGEGFEPTPPPYSSRNVANWLLYEQATNSFINSASFETTPLTISDGLVNQMSVESELGASLTLPSEVSSFMGTSMDLNANFTEEDISGVSTSGYFDDCCESDMTASVLCNKKRVRFSLSGNTCSSNSSNEANSAAATNDNPTKVSFMAGGTSSANTQFHSFLRQQSARSCNATDSQNMSYSALHLVNDGSHIPIFGSVDEIYNPRNRNRTFNCNKSVLENPPSYIDSEMMTSWWRMRKECIPEKVNVGKALHNDNCFSNTATTNRVHKSQVSNGITKTSVLGTSNSQQVPVSESS